MNLIEARHELLPPRALGLHFNDQRYSPQMFLRFTADHSSLNSPMAEEGVIG